MQVNEQEQQAKKPVQAIAKQIKDGLHLAAQLILASPLKLPLKLVKGAKYVALAIGLLDQIVHHNDAGHPEEASLKPSHEADGT